MTTLTEFQPRVWLTELELDEFDVRGAVLLGSRGALVWDTLSHPRDMGAVRQLIGERPLTVVYSHADWDHVWGTAGLPATDIVGHEGCLGRFSGDVPATLRRKLAERPDLWTGVQLVAPNRTFADSLTIELGDLSVELHHLPGHTADCCVGFVPRRRLLLMGDTVETPLPVVNEGSPIAEWIAGLERWAADERVETVIPAHGPPCGREIIRRTIGYLRALQSGGNPEVADGLTPFYRETHDRNQRLVRPAKQSR